MLDADTVVPAKQMEAIRESVEDYEYLVMLRAAVRRARSSGRSGPAVTRAEALLKSAAQEVLSAPGVEQIFWHKPKDRTQADAALVRILEALVALGP